MNKVKSSYVVALLFLAFSLMLSACGGSGTSGQQGGVESEKAQKALASLKGKVLSTGPHGEEPTPGSEVKLSDQELKQIKAKNATAAIVMRTAKRTVSIGRRSPRNTALAGRTTSAVPRTARM